jgi:dodecin
MRWCGFQNPAEAAQNACSHSLNTQENSMSVAKVIEIISESKLSFEDAVQQGVARASETIHGVASAWVKDQSVTVSGGKVVLYRVVMKLTFVLEGAAKAAPKGKGKAKGK